MKFPVTLEPQEDGTILALVPDVQGTVTDGDTEEEALHEVADAVIAALCGHMYVGHDVPKPSLPAPGQPVVTLSELVVKKLGLYQAMKNAGMSHADLAAYLGKSESEVRELLDLDHESEVEKVAAAVAALKERPGKGQAVT